jgi:hypothetical protein
MSPQLLLGVAFLALVIGLAVWACVWNIKAKKALRLGVESHGFTLTKGPSKHAEEIAARAPLPEGTRCRYSVDWWGEGKIDDVDVTMLCHRTVRRAGKSTETLYTMISRTECPSAWPGLRLQAETFISKMAKKVGVKDLEVENEAFNKRWLINANDEEFAVLLLSPEVQEWLLDANKKESWSILDGHLICTWHKRLKPKELDLFVGRVATFRRLIPPELDAWTPSETPADAGA